MTESEALPEKRVIGFLSRKSYRW